MIGTREERGQKRRGLEKYSTVRYITGVIMAKLVKNKFMCSNIVTQMLDYGQHCRAWVDNMTGLDFFKCVVTALV